MELTAAGILALVALFILTRLFSIPVNWGVLILHGVALALVTLFTGKGLTNIMNSMRITGEVARVSIPMIVGFTVTELLNAFLPAWRPEGK